MGRLRDIVEAQPTGRGGGCDLSKILPKLDAADRTDLVDVLADPDVTAVAIERALHGLGYTELSVTTVQRHRRTAQGRANGCKCPPETFQ